MGNQNYVKDIVWNQLIQISKSIGEDEEWSLFGDFNQVLCRQDKFSFKDHSLKGADLFFSVLMNANFVNFLQKGNHKHGPIIEKVRKLCGRDLTVLLLTATGSTSIVIHL
ncbi:hypothetical protein PTKIN_Ptkin19aG0028700 [Pterospermum kingtungense]